MNYALILAGGSGTRMGNTGIPKQFLSIKDKPILIYALENTLACKKIDKVVLVCKSDYVSYAHNLLFEYELANSVVMTEGGESRLDSVMNGLNFIKEHFGVKKDDIFLVNDSVRIFTSQRIFEECIDNAKEHSGASTVYHLEETVSEANEDGLLFHNYPRKNHYSVQSPQAFNIQEFLDAIAKLTDEQRASLTDLAEAFYNINKPVYPVIGEKENIKITTPFDIELATRKIERAS